MEETFPIEDGFFKGIVLDGPLGKVEYHAIPGKFKVRGSPSTYSFIFVINGYPHCLVKTTLINIYILLISKNHTAKKKQ